MEVVTTTTIITKSETTADLEILAWKICQTIDCYPSWITITKHAVEYRHPKRYEQRWEFCPLSEEELKVEGDWDYSYNLFEDNESHTLTGYGNWNGLHRLL